VSSHHLSHKRLKSVQRFELGRIGEKSITRTGEDRTIEKSQKRNISHIWGQAHHEANAMKYGTGVDVHKVVAWAEFDL